jgi:rhodanese-related sulfurtransferase
MAVNNIDPQALKSKLDKKEKFILIDCREQAEWDSGHIEGATLLPLSQFQARYSDILKDKQAEIVLQCRSGGRSMQAASFLVSQGYTSIYNLHGGLMNWMSLQLPIKK